MLDLLGFQPQCSDIKLQGLHEEALYMTFNCCHDLRVRITDQHFHFFHRARNHRHKENKAIQRSLKISFRELLTKLQYYGSIN